jgi:hypothetical protein
MSLSPAAAEVLRQLMELPAEERAEAAAALRASLEGTSWELQEPELGASYGAAEVVMSTDQPTPEEEAELNRRLAAVRSGESKLSSRYEVMENIKRHLSELRSQSDLSASTVS